MTATGSGVRDATAAEYRLRRVRLDGQRTHGRERLSAPRSPEAGRIREVGPRDGFQNEPEVIPTERKVELIDALARTGLRRLEVTSFVRADVIPQLADAARGAGARSTCPRRSACRC